MPITVVDNTAPDANPVAGEFELLNLAFGTYTIVETVPPAGFTLDSTVDTEVVTAASPNVTASHVFVDTPVATGGASATMGFWQNKNGQAVIKSAPTIGTDLATLYPNLFGTGAATFNLNGPMEFMNLTGQSASNVAAYFVKIFNVTGPHTYAQVMSNVLADYFDSINPTSTGNKFGFGGNLGTTAITLTATDAAAAWSADQHDGWSISDGHQRSHCRRRRCGPAEPVRRDERCFRHDQPDERHLIRLMDRTVRQNKTPASLPRMRASFLLRHLGGMTDDQFKSWRS